ncbi:hypothetical protein ABT173_48620 [Streptomyces sp. NPDC001795]|uniref:hypothetical protein n=1 Tax=unclassified Streptomyces TaxID=2593676 RepID=UPI00331DD401
MRRYIPPIAVVLLTAACSSGMPKPTLTARDPIGKPTKIKHSATAHPHRIARGQAEGLAFVEEMRARAGRHRLVQGARGPGSAQVIGNCNLVSCETTFDELQHT